MPERFPFHFPAFDDGPPAAPTLAPPRLVVDRNQYVSIHTFTGKQIYQYTPDHQLGLGWGREKNQTSKCEITVPSQLAEGVVPKLVPWLHWASVWDEHGKRLHWTGPIQDWEADKDKVSIAASDFSALFDYQVNPITKRWETTDPAFIAGELLERILDQQGLAVAPRVIPDPRLDKFDFATVFESQSLRQTMTQLVDYGLSWSVSMGTPVLGPLSFKPITALSETDFVDGSPTISRTGKDMANEIILRAPGTIARARVPGGGLNLQRIIDVDSMFSVSNAQRVAEQQVRYTSKVRDILSLPGDVRLHPEAPVGLDQLVPTARFTIEAYGILALMELISMQVKCFDGEIAVHVTMANVDDDPTELNELIARNDTGGGGV